jgi:hypothetical protein
MQFRVLWAPDAEAAFQRLVDASSDPKSLAAAARQIDERLLAAPKSFGESRHDAVRVGFVYPLGVDFEVMDDVRTVIVHYVWRIDRK